MKIYNLNNAHRHFVNLIKNQAGVVRGQFGIQPFEEKACIFFDDTYFYVYAEQNFLREMPRKKKNTWYIKFLVNIWIKFPDDAYENDVLQMNQYLNDTIKTFDRNCRSYISMGISMIKRGTWSKNRSCLIFTFEITEFPVRHDIIDVIKNVLRQAQEIFHFTFPDKKEELKNSFGHMEISEYIEELYQARIEDEKTLID